MLLNEGELDGARILKPSTVRLMATDQLDPAIEERAWLPGKGAVGFGFDFAVRKSPPQTAEENRGATGEYFWDGMARSEEHTSELQSLMRNSYAVFCLKKKKKQESGNERKDDNNKESRTEIDA